jgi:pimeloyl-ACP methyl ester carboxylesterase
VAVIHGLWGDDSLWQEFRPLVWGTDQSDPRFAVFRINYGGNIGAQVAETQPHYAAATQAKTTGSALGFERNAGEAQSQIRRQLATFKNGRNPAAMSVAAVQVDVIGHSMGGNVTRTMPLLRDFLQGNTYGQGIVHKLITVDTPHRGSTLANLLVGQIRGGHFCVPFFLADWGKSVVLRSATLRDGSTVSGAVGDLVPGSDAQQRMDGQRVRQIPTATVAGVYTNWSYLSGHDVGGLPVPNFAVNLLHETCKLDALALSLNQVTWPTLFGEDSDATVGLSSQDPFNVGRHFQNYVHSPGMVSLGFAPPPIISSENGGEVAAHVISLLNKPLSDTAYMKLP